MTEPLFIEMAQKGRNFLVNVGKANAIYEENGIIYLDMGNNNIIKFEGNYTTLKSKLQLKGKIA
jgi:hypothetical protein